jgi:hypothetical protein
MEICSHCPVKDSVSYVTKTEVKYKDTTIYITQQGPIQYLENPCKLLCDSLGNLKKFEITKKENGIIGTIKSVGNTIAFDCKADSLAKELAALIKIIQESKVKEQTKTLPPVVTNELTKLQGFWIISSQIWWLLAIIIGGWKAIKYYRKFHLPLP